MKSIHVVGLDVAFVNFGMARAKLNNMGIDITELKLLSTTGQDKKVVRKSSDDLRRAREIIAPFHTFCLPATIAFAEVPHGSQSSRASWSLGISVGILASCPIPVIQVSALEVKMATVGKKTAGKDEMIEWAVNAHPDAQWLRHKKRLTAANEHLADAVATIYAGMKTDEFKRLVAMFYSDPDPRLKSNFESTHFMTSGVTHKKYPRR